MIMLVVRCSLPSPAPPSASTECLAARGKMPRRRFAATTAPVGCRGLNASVECRAADGGKTPRRRFAVAAGGGVAYVVAVAVVVPVPVGVNVEAPRAGYMLVVGVEIVEGTDGAGDSRPQRKKPLARRVTVGESPAALLEDGVVEVADCGSGIVCMDSVSEPRRWLGTCCSGGSRAVSTERDFGFVFRFVGFSLSLSFPLCSFSFPFPLGSLSVRPDRKKLKLLNRRPSRVFRFHLNFGSRIALASSAAETLMRGVVALRHSARRCMS
ncbi:hypothetical protein K438DRAFT_81651 [Mycena galopus ATCC 62051]|nr:hypothetical protein K438DRAFT_81651 [Mycena galopus ATCC 62051]